MLDYIRYLFLCALALPLFGQGWADLPNTKLQTVIPANGATFANFAWTGTPFYDNRYRPLTSWASCAVDTKRARLLCQGDGHNGTDNNAVYSLDLVTRSVSVGTSCGAATNCSSNATAPTVTRLNDPSTGGSGSWAMVGCPASVPADGAPIARQSYGGLLYMPRSDTLWNYGISDRCVGAFGTNGYGNSYVLAFHADGSVNGWTKMTGTCSACSAGLGPSTGGAGTLCVNDVLYTGPEDAAICATQNTFLYRYKLPSNYATNTAGDSWTLITNPTLQSGNSGSLVLDPKRRMLYSFGPNFDATSPRILQVLYDSPFTQTDITSSTTGCADLYSYTYPSLVYDPALDRIVGYVPQTVASEGNAYPNNAVNEIVIFDPATKTCVIQPQLGTPTTFNPASSAAGCTIGSITSVGPPADCHVLAANGAGQASLGHFNYIPSLGEYVLMLNQDQDAFVFKMNANATHGLASSTLTCVDRDGDGYGIGPGCTGPDGDDQDAGVHTMAQLCNKWNATTCGTPTNAQILVVLQHLGYNPANIWYIATTGNDGTGAVNNPSLPFATCCSAGHANPAAGDAVLWRSGTYGQFTTLSGGSSGHPTIYMSYPGELATFSGGAANGFDMTNSQTFIVIDTFKVSGCGSNNGAIRGAENTNIVIRHVETTNCKWGLSYQGDTQLAGCPLTTCQPLNEMTVQDSILHDDNMPSEEHGFYYSSHSGATSTNIFVSRTIAYNNNLNGFHLTGQFSNVHFSQNLSYNNLTAGVSWQLGTSNSFLLDHVSINDFQGIDIDMYDGTNGSSICGTGAQVCTCSPANYASICPTSQSNNLISNISVYMTGTAGDGSSAGKNGALIMGRQGASACSSSGCLNATMTGNVFQNFVAVTNNTLGGSFASGSSYPPFIFPDNTGVTFLPNTTFKNITVLDQSNSGIVVGYGLGASFGYSPLNCTGLASTAMSSVSCQNADPKYVATCAFNTIGSCNLRLQQGVSPAINAGMTVSYPAFDLIGASLPAISPNEGAYQATCFITPTSLGPWTDTQVINQNLTQSGCPASTWSLAGSWPTGLSGCNSGSGTTCTVSGTINEPAGGTSNPSVSYATATNNYSITVNPVPSITTSCPLPNGNQLQAYSDTLTSSGGTAPLAWSLSSGSLPNGLTLSAGGVISGTPTLSGTSTFTLQVTDANNISATKSCSLFIIQTIPQLGTVSGKTVSGQTR